MKIRNGFVSNSSSSSFIIIGNGKVIIPDYSGKTYIVGESGTIDFGWGPKIIDDFNSRVNFAYLQAYYLDDTQGCNINRKLIDNILHENIKCSYIIHNNHDGYIDHQSSAEEGENIEMFGSKEAMFNFLFCVDSEIHLDNDNH